MGEVAVNGQDGQMMAASAEEDVLQLEGMEGEASKENQVASGLVNGVLMTNDRIKRRAKRPSKFHLGKEIVKDTTGVVAPIRALKNSRKSRNGFGRGLPKKDVDTALRIELCEVKENLRLSLAREKVACDLSKKAANKEKKLRKEIDEAKKLVEMAEGRERGIRNKYEEYTNSTNAILERAATVRENNTTNLSDKVKMSELTATLDTVKKEKIHLEGELDKLNEGVGKMILERQELLGKVTSLVENVDSMTQKYGNLVNIRDNMVKEQEIIKSNNDREHGVKDDRIKSLLDQIEKLHSKSSEDRELAETQIRDLKMEVDKALERNATLEYQMQVVTTSYTSSKAQADSMTRLILANASSQTTTTHQGNVNSQDGLITNTGDPTLPMTSTSQDMHVNPRPSTSKTHVNTSDDYLVGITKALSLKQEAFLKFVVTSHNIHEAKMDAKIEHIMRCLQHNGLHISMQAQDDGACYLPEVPSFRHHVHGMIDKESQFFASDPIARQLRVIILNCLKQTHRLQDMQQSKVTILTSNVGDVAAALAFLSSTLGIAIINLTINLSAINKP